MESSSTKVLPRDAHQLAICPFCGKEANVFFDETTSWVRCGFCGAQTNHFKHNYGGASAESAVNAWNRRYKTLAERTVKPRNGDYEETSLHEACRPAVEWLQRHGNPHSHIIIEQDSAEFLVGERSAMYKIFD